MQFIIFLAIIILLGSVWFAKKEVLSQKAKIAFLGSIVVIIALASWYELMQGHSSEEHRLTLNAFKQGKTLYCDDKEISKKTFIYVNGTLSFIPSDTNKDDKGVVIDIATCKLER